MCMESTCSYSVHIQRSYILHDEKENGRAMSYLTLCMHYGSVVQDHTLQLKPNNLALQRYHNDT